MSEFDKQSNIFSRQHQVILQTTEDQQIHLPQQQPLEIKVENENESKIGNELKLPPIVSPKVQQPIRRIHHDMFLQRLDHLCGSRVGEVIYLNIYNVTGINKFLEVLGFGLYHTSVGMYDLEFSYGGHNEDTSGIVVVERGNSAGLELRESLPIGFTYYTGNEIDEIVDFFGEFWLGKDYDPFAKNCNHFTEALIRSVCEKEEFYVPSYVNRFTKLGSVFRMWFKPLQELVGDIVNYEDEPCDVDSEEEQDSYTYKADQANFFPEQFPSQFPPQ